MEIYATRYAAEKAHGRGTGAIVKVSSDVVIDAYGRIRPSASGFGYQWMDWKSYFVWRSQK